jgi:hypothetical protein
MNYQQLVDKLSTGQYSLATLPPEDVAMLASTIRPGSQGFTQEQSALLDGFYLLAPSEAAIDQLNEGRMHQLAKIQDLSGDWLTLASALSDCRPGETFAHARESISTWLIVRRTPSDFPEVSDDG